MLCKLVPHTDLAFIFSGLSEQSQIPALLVLLVTTLMCDSQVASDPKVSVTPKYLVSSTTWRA